MLQYGIWALGTLLLISLGKALALLCFDLTMMQGCRPLATFALRVQGALLSVKGQLPAV